jgi:hypothetical protein
MDKTTMIAAGSIPVRREAAVVRHRARMFDSLMSVIETWSEATAARVQVLSAPWPILPKIAVVHERVVCNDQAMDLRGKPTVLKLFAVFQELGGGPIGRKELLAEVYGIDDVNDRSDRFVHASLGNLVKMISRGRRLAQAYLSGGENQGIEWFVYDSSHKTWSFYRLSSDYIERRMQRLAAEPAREARARLDS